MSPASILATKFAQAKASISQRATERKLGMTRLSPSSMPPYPAHRPMCVVVLVVSTFLFSIFYFVFTLSTKREMPPCISTGAETWRSPFRFFISLISESGWFA